MSSGLAVRAPNWVGDLVMATPVLRAAVEAHRAGRFERLSVLVRAHLAAVLAGTEIEPYVVPLAGRAAETAAWRRLEPEVALLLSNSWGAAWRAFRAGVPVRAGSSLGGRRAFLTHAVCPPVRDGRRVPIPTAHLLRDVAGLVGLRVPDLHPRLALSGVERRAWREELATLGIGLDQGYVLCCPGAAFGAAKLWPPERFARVLDALWTQRGLRGVVSGGPGEEPQLAAVVAAATSAPLSLADRPRDLGRLRALVAEAELVLVGDSGPRWYAAAFDVPWVTVMGPNFPELTATSLELGEIVRTGGLECAPCLQRSCPFGHHRCMTELEPGEVVDAALRVLAAREPGPAAGRRVGAEPGA